VTRRARGTFSDVLVRVWRLLAAGQESEARAKLLSGWSMGADAFAGEQTAYVALRLLERLAPVTDDVEGWTRLPVSITVFRAGMPEGFAWTTNRETAESLARRLQAQTGFDVAIHTGTVNKPDVLAYITGYGEDEIVVPWERVTVREDARPVQTPVEPRR
jgi:hypothetical protein